MNRKTLASIAERVVRAFAVAFVGTLLLSGFGTGGVVDMSLLEKAGLAGLVAVLNLVLSLLGTTVGNPASPSLLPASADPATPPPSPAVAAIAAPVLRGDWGDGSSPFASVTSSPTPFAQNLTPAQQGPDIPPPEDCPTLAWRYQQ